MKKRSTKIILSMLAMMVVFAAIFLIYASDYYRADDLATQMMKNEGTRAEGNLIILSPSVPSEKGIIFYPGAKVEETAYLPLLEILRQNGVTCVLVKMPFHLALLNSDAADTVIARLPEIKQWYIAGHSLGGAMASGYASKHQDKIAGLILLGAYIYGDIPTDKAVIIYGSEDLVLNKAKISDTAHVFLIEGGNHAQFGNYGKQKGDGDATITAKEQQEKTAAIMLNYIHK